MTITEATQHQADDFRGLPLEQITWGPCPSWCTGEHYEEVTREGLVRSRSHTSTDTPVGGWGIAQCEDVQPDGTTTACCEAEVSTNLAWATTSETCRQIAQELLAVADVIDAG